MLFKGRDRPMQLTPSYRVQDAAVAVRIECAMEGRNARGFLRSRDGITNRIFRISRRVFRNERSFHWRAGRMCEIREHTRTSDGEVAMESASSTVVACGDACLGDGVSLTALASSDSGGYPGRDNDLPNCSSVSRGLLLVDWCG